MIGFVRSLIFIALFYLCSILTVLAILPLMLAPGRWMHPVVRLWAQATMALVRVVCGVRVEFRGLEHLPSGGALIAAKHQCMFDTIAPVTLFANPAYVMRDSLLKIPFYGWYAVKSGMIPINRDGGAGALRAMLSLAKTRVRENRQIVIFPEGTRTAPGTTGEYKPGVAALYRALGLPCTPMATNSGVHWPAHGFLRRPGLVVYEFLEPLPPGLERDAFMRLLEERLEGASRALLPL
jgi:1-acyl-sn-glycerol-3-phosphate acyltransferase